MTRDARAYWKAQRAMRERMAADMRRNLFDGFGAPGEAPAGAKSANRPAEDFERIRKRLAEIRNEEQRAREA